jgi:hypothetical protein
MRIFLNGLTIVATVAMLAMAGACAPSQLGEIGSVNLLPKVGNLSRPDWLTYSGGKNEFALRQVTDADLMSADGQCAATAEQAAAAAGSEDGTPQTAGLLPGGIALQMTECDVVRRAGAPEQLQFGTNERGERTAVITYVRGSRPGVYHFVAGRLASIERAPEPATARPQPKGKSKKSAGS